MNLREKLRNMDKRLRVMLIATVILLVPQIGQFIAIRDINSTGHVSALAFLFLLLGIFVVPTSVILSVAIIASVRRSWRSHSAVVILGVLNLLIAFSLIWFFVNQCAWATVFGLVIKGCVK
jgi:hypothetical protein